MTAFAPDALEAAVFRARAGDEDGVRVLYRWLHVPLLRYLRHHVGADAEDVASETWMSVARLVHRFEGGPAEFRALLFAVARRRVVDQHRRNGRALKLVRVAAGDELDQAGKQTPTPAAEKVVLDNLSTQQAIELLAAVLPPEQLEVILLRVVADLSVNDVARILDKAPAAVRASQYRAIHKLQQTLDRRSVTL